MAAKIIYMMNGQGADPAILKGLVEAGCEVSDTHSVAETFCSLRNGYSRSGAKNFMLVAEVQAGAIPLLTLLHETGVALPPTLLFDQEGNSLQPAIKALQLGVQDYILASEPALQRELRARVLAERLVTIAGKSTLGTKPATMEEHTPAISYTAIPAEPTQSTEVDTDVEFQWDPESHVIYIHNTYVRLSPVEGRIFGLLLARRNHAVSAEEMLEVGLKRIGGDLEEGIKLLRPHIMRLRNKLERHPKLAHRVVNVRSNGYMFV
jgi:DNA-binding response OmpR family regulator